MQGLKPEEVTPYCISRLKLAGLHEETFSTQALDAICTITAGLPRLINNLITTSLLCACEKRQRRIDEEIIYQAQTELNIQYGLLPIERIAIGKRLPRHQKDVVRKALFPHFRPDMNLSTHPAFHQPTIYVWVNFSLILFSLWNIFFVIFAVLQLL
jgi:hypothetical protein